MTQSGGRGLSPAEFVQRLARETDLSATEIGRQARAIGYRIGNDLLRAIVNAGRGRTVTPRQRSTFLAFGVKLSARDPEGFRRSLGQVLTKAVGETVQRTRLAVTVQATADVGFRWDRSRSVDDRSQRVSVTQTLNIRADQVEAFNANIQRLGASFVPQLIQRGGALLSVNQNYGDVILLDQPRLEVVRVAQL